MGGGGGGRVDLILFRILLRIPHENKHNLDNGGLTEPHPSPTPSKSATEIVTRTASLGRRPI